LIHRTPDHARARQSHLPSHLLSTGVRCLRDAIKGCRCCLIQNLGATRSARQSTRPNNVRAWVGSHPSKDSEPVPEKRRRLPILVKFCCFSLELKVLGPPNLGTFCDAIAAPGEVSIGGYSTAMEPEFTIPAVPFGNEFLPGFQATKSG